MRPSDQERLLRRARSAYERGRAMKGLRTSALVLPMVLASFGGCGSRATSIAIGVALATLAAVLVWRGGTPGRAVTPGLLAGVAPLAIPLLACPALERAGFTGALPLLACVSGGLVSGAIVTHYATCERERDERVPFIVAAGVVAALAGSLGCVEVGLGGVAAMAAGLVLVAPLGLRAPASG